MRLTRLAPALALSALLLSAGAAPAQAQAAPPASKPAYGTFGFDTAGMDRSAQPGDDFFAYANGGWVKRTEIPADRSSYNSFTVLVEAANRRTREIIEGAASDRSAAGDARKVGDYYASFIDEAAVERRGLEPVRTELAVIAAVKDRRRLSAELGRTLRADVDMLNATDLYTDRPLGLWVAEDWNAPARYTAYLMQGGLGLPEREYYLSDKPKFAELRPEYRAHIARVLALGGFDRAEERAARVLALETAIARTHWSQTDSADPTKANNPWKRADFAGKAPGIDWDAYFAAAGLAGQASFIVAQSSAVAGISKLAASEPVEAWKDYLAFHALERGSPLLPKAFVEESFAFNGKTLNGTPQLAERWKRGVNATNAALGEAVGRLYVERHFTPEAKAQADEIVRNLIKAFDARIAAVDWMSPATKAKARQKLATLTVGIGYPDRWRDYSGLRIVRGDAYGNWQRAELFDYRRNLAKLSGPVDRNEWHLLPHEVNALNAPLQNSIIFPAAILQPTFFDPAADPAVNYGAIGGVIGHEITHSFDDTGALFDPQGKLANWWTEADFKSFRARGQALAEQYSKYCPLGDVCVNGELTLGENIADLGGLAAAYDAYRISLSGRRGPVIEGFTPEQRVFLGWAQNYRSKFREPTLRRVLLTDPHSPGEYRADTVRNLEGWYQAFGVKPGQKLYLAPERRVRIW
ncbi:MAG TPA: M13 family metallopeptidase [Caulobacteraceae bacterium]